MIRVTGSPPAAAVIEVVDSGPGIVEELRSRIFDRHYRANGTRSLINGTGLGLSIAKWSMESCAGQLSVEATPGGGSTFRMTLPSAAAACGQIACSRTA